MATYVNLCGFKEFHTTSALLKSTLFEIWEKETLDKMCNNKFRTYEDIVQWAIKNWQFMEGKFEPINPKNTLRFDISDKNSLIIRALQESKYKVICINDANMNYDFGKAKAEIIAAFEEIFPQKSTFENYAKTFIYL